MNVSTRAVCTELLCVRLARLLAVTSLILRAAVGSGGGNLIGHELVMTLAQGSQFSLIV